MEPAIATDVASNTSPVVMVSTRNTMVEKKSLASLANTSFIVAFPAGRFRSGFGRRCRSGRRPVLRPAGLRGPSGKVPRPVARGKRDAETDPQRQAWEMAHQGKRDQHQHEGAGP